MMTINELMEQLQDAADEIGGDAEVRLAEQPAWPFEYSIRNQGAVVFLPDTEDGPEQAIYYLAEGTQLAYLSGEARDALGWSR